MVGAGTVRELIESVGGEHIVEFAVKGDAGVVDVARLTAIAGVHSHRVDAGLHQLSVTDLHTTVPQVFEQMEAMGLTLSEFRTHSATLEDVFVQLTGRNLRDE